MSRRTRARWRWRAIEAGAFRSIPLRVICLIVLRFFLIIARRHGTPTENFFVSPSACIGAFIARKTHICTNIQHNSRPGQYRVHTWTRTQLWWRWGTSSSCGYVGAFALYTYNGGVMADGWRLVSLAHILHTHTHTHIYRYIYILYTWADVRALFASVAAA